MFLRRTFKQIIFGGIYVLVFGFIVYRIGVKFMPAPPPETPTPLPVKPLIVKSVQLLPVHSLDYDIVMTVKNPNLLFGASNFGYKIEFQGEQEKSFEFTGNSFILPGQEKRIIVSSLRPPIALTAGTGIITDVTWDKVKEFVQNASLFVVRDQRTEFQDTVTVVTARVKNVSNFDFASVLVSGFIQWPDGGIAAVSTRQEQTFRARSERDVQLVFPKVIPSGRITIEVYTNVFENVNFLRESGTEEQFRQAF